MLLFFRQCLSMRTIIWLRVSLCTISQYCWSLQTAVRCNFYYFLLQVKHPQDVLPPALGASMYAIACILSYDGLPDMCPSNDLLQNSVEARRFSLGKRGYIPPGGYLRSFADRPHHAPHFQNLANHPGGDPAYTQPSRAPVGRFDQSQRSFRNSGPGSSKTRSFKRQRNTAL